MLHAVFPFVLRACEYVEGGVGCTQSHASDASPSIRAQHGSFVMKGSNSVRGDSFAHHHVFCRRHSGCAGTVQRRCVSRLDYVLLYVDRCSGARLAIDPRAPRTCARFYCYSLAELLRSFALPPGARFERAACDNTGILTARQYRVHEPRLNATAMAAANIATRAGAQVGWRQLTRAGV
eukprot:scaffold85080_cov31-Tisochrysis_lutea.AAC.2